MPRGDPRSRLRSCEVPADRAAKYRAEGWWDSRVLADGLEAAAARRPHALAVTDSERLLTFAELTRCVRAGVARLRSWGVNPGDGAILIGGNTLATVVGYHSLLRVGCTTLVLDRRCGPADVRAALEVLPGAGVIVSAGERSRLLDDLSGRALGLDAFDGVSSNAPAVDWSEPDRNAPAVVLFTSGTTSRPKAVVHSLNTLTAGAANMACITGAAEDAVVYLVSPITSITGVMQMHLSADQHCALVLDDHFDPEASLDRINAVGATLLGGAPVIAERLLRAAGRRGRRQIALRTLALGGSMLPRPLLELATDVFGVEIARVYGSSEAPNFSGSLPTDDRDRRLSDDGLLMPGSEVRVGSSSNSQEGLLRGPSVFLGYVDPDDQGAAFNDGWFRTGDLIDVHDNRVTVIGRLKDVVNRSGLKISLEEIDAALAGMVGVREHACFALPDPATGERLAVAIHSDQVATLTLGHVIDHLTERGTAERKLPEQLVFWDGPLPRTPSGKVVRSRLVMDAPGKRSEYAARVQTQGDDGST